MIVALAAKVRKTQAQVILRWHIDHGVWAVPKSFRPERIAENFDIFDFALTEEDIAVRENLQHPDVDLLRRYSEEQEPLTNP